MGYTIKKPWYKRIRSRKKKDTRIPGEIVIDENGNLKPCSKNWDLSNPEAFRPGSKYRRINTGLPNLKNMKNCEHDEFCAEAGSKKGFCVYNYSPKQIKEGRKEAMLLKELEYKRKYNSKTSKRALLGRKRKSRKRKSRTRKSRTRKSRK